MSKLKKVLDRRLFRHGGMLGPEDPQGILNSSPELANVVFRRHGGVHIAPGPSGVSQDVQVNLRDPFDVPGIPSDELFLFDSIKIPPSDREEMRRQIENEERAANKNISEEELAIRVETRMRAARLSGIQPERGERTPGTPVADFFERRRNINRYEGAYPGPGFRSPQRWEAEIAADPRQSFTLKGLRQAEEGSILGAEELRKQFPDHYEGTYEEYLEESARKKEEKIRIDPGKPITAQELRKGLDPYEDYYEGTYEDYLKESAREKKAEPRTEPGTEPGTVAGDGSEAPPEAPPEAPQIDSATIDRLFESGPDADPLDKKETALDILRKRLAESKGEKVDKKKLKEEIDALLPAIENDRVSEGLMAMIVGAKIAEKGVAAGLSESLPQAMEFFNKQHAQKQAREREVATATITEGFSREREQRVNDRALEMAVFESDLRIEQFKEEERYKAIFDTEPYVVINNSTHSIDGKDVRVPFGTPLSLNSDQINQLGDLGIQVIPLENYDEDMMAYLIGGDKDLTAEGIVARLSGKERNYLYSDPENITAFANFGSKYNFSIMRPKAALILDPILRAEYGDTPKISSAELLGLRRAYKTAIQDGKHLYDDIGGLINLSRLTPAEGGGAMSGLPRIKGELLEALRASKIPGIDTWADDLIGGPIDPVTGKKRDITQLSEFQVRSRLILAKIAPILLGESGRTISNEDRERVAQALGFDVSYPGGKMTLTAPRESYFKDERVIRLALEVTRDVLVRNMNQVGNEFHSHLQMLGLNPERQAVQGYDVPTKRQEEIVSTLFADLTT